MPTAITPMHPNLVTEPFHHEGWVYEEKVDGYRVLAHKDGDRVRLVSRSFCFSAAQESGYAVRAKVLAR